MAVLQKVISGNDYINGAAVVRSDKLGNVDKLAQTINDNTGITGINTILDSRHDEPRYYTGDASGI